MAASTDGSQNENINVFRAPAKAGAHIDFQMGSCLRRNTAFTMKHNIPSPKAVIFDWDDTLVDTWPVTRAAMNTMLVKMGHQPWSEDEARRNIGPSARELFPRLFGDRWEEADRIYYQAAREGFRDNMKLINGAAELLKRIADMEIFMAVVSNKRGALLREEVETLQWRHFFRSVVGAGDASADKPDPATVYLALENSNIMAGPDVWFVGNNHMDMTCAHRAGCIPLLLETKLPPEDLLKDCPPLLRFKDCSDLSNFIMNNY